MNKDVKKKLDELTEDARIHGPAAVLTVLHMLQGACLNGTHNEFAKHCCQFSPLSLNLDPQMLIPPDTSASSKLQ